VKLVSGSSQSRWALLLTSAIISGLFIFQTTRIWLASARIDSDQLPSIERGAQLEPGNAEAWDRLGRFRQWNLDNPDPAAAVNDYQMAVREEPQSPYYWMDLAGAYEQTDDVARAREAFERAEAAYPISAQVAWQYGSFLLRQEDATEGLKQIQRAVRIDPSLLPLTISRVWLSTHDVNLLIGQVLPPNVDAYFQALDFFQSIQQSEAALAVWRKLLSLGAAFPLKRSFPFIDELIREDRARDAQTVWLEAVHAAGMRKPAIDSSLIWDGGFTQDFANGGLGWRWDSPLGVAIDFDAGRLMDETRSVRLDFSGGNNTDLDAPMQFVVVEPNRAYHFRGYLRTERITTESGPRFSIVDPRHPNEVSVVTDNLVGTNPWVAADADFVTGSETRFVVVRLLRPPSRLFENKLAGSAWIADLSLVPLSPGQGALK
jgi:tetratricopeptide (TPR) repeat protein